MNPHWTGYRPPSSNSVAPAVFPSGPPPRKSSSSFIPWVVGLAGLLGTSCVGGFGYLVYQSQTPEGKASRAAAQAERRGKTESVRATLTKLSAVAKATHAVRELIAARRVAALLRREHERHIRPDVATHEAEAFRHDPDDAVRVAVEPDARVDDVRLPAEPAAP